MRTILLLALIPTLLLAPANAFAGRDDSGLQLYTINFAELLGQTANIAQEDTKISPYCYNLFLNGNGYCSIPQPIGSGYEWTNGAASQIILSQTYTYFRLTIASGMTGTIVRMLTPLLNSAQETLVSGISNTSDFKVFPFDVYTYLFCGSKIIKVTTATGATSEVSLPAALLYTSSDVWQNRLWIASADFIFYSAAMNYDDFSSTATTGGVTRIPSCGSIYKIIGTKYGLYVFTQNGIYLQAGASKNWEIVKISDLRLVKYDMATSYNDTIIFADATDTNRKIWQIASTDISEVCDVPPGYESAQITFDQLRMINSGKTLVLSSIFPNFGALLYDLTTKSWAQSGEFSFVGETYFIKKTDFTKYKIYQLPMFQKVVATHSTIDTPLYPWGYYTAWMTIDGNASNRKEIDRIEFDYQGGTTNVQLYYAYGNGSQAAATTAVLIAPVSTRLNTYVWNNPMGKAQSNRFQLQFVSSGAQTMTDNYVLKQARIYYRVIGNYTNNNLR